jgi:hypothetical protein
MILWWLQKRKLPAPSHPRNVRPPLPAALVRPPCTHLNIVGSSRPAALGDIVRVRLFWPIAIGFALMACAVQRAQIANDAQSKMIGLSKEQILTCMGPPLNKAAEGGTEVWSYNSGNSVTPTGDGNGRYCTINIKMWNGRVGVVDYLGPSGGLLTPNEACAFAVEKCAGKP